MAADGSSDIGAVITLDNFATALSQFDVTDTGNQLYGLVDMGSNGIRFSISDLSPPQSRLLPCIYRERIGISLYDALHESSPESKPGYFSTDTIKDVAGTLGRFKDICDAYNVKKSHINVFATEAMRTAKNKNEMVQAIRDESGLSVDIMDPKMESMFGAMGARSAFVDVDGLFMDLGGGSVQMTYVNSKNQPEYNILAAEAATSMPFGAAKLTQALGSQSTGEVATKELQTSMKDALKGLAGRFPTLKEHLDSDEGLTIYFCGGGFRGYGSMLMHTDPIRPYPIPSIGGFTVPGELFVRWKKMLEVHESEKGKITGMSKRRREQFPAIVTVVRALIEAIPKHSKIKQVIFCSGGNREGVLFMKLPPQIRETHPVPLLPPTIAEKNGGVIVSIITTLLSAIPEGCEDIFPTDIFHYIAKSIWVEMGDSGDANSAKALHEPISGLLAGHPGLHHESRALLALTLCARWGTDLGSSDRKLHENLRALVGLQKSWWCDYIGILASFLATIMPVFPANEQALKDAVTFEASSSHGLGKKGHKVGVRLRITLSKKARRGLHIGDLEGMFKKVGKGLLLDYKVQAEII